MSLPIVMRPEAQSDLLAARRWYEGQREGLGDLFADAFEEVIAVLHGSRSPRIWQDRA